MANRRNFIKKTAAVMAVSLTPLAYASVDKVVATNTPKPRLLSKRLRKGDTIGLVAPGGPIRQKQLDETIKKLKNLGFKSYHTKSVLAEYGYFAGSDQVRADDLMHMFSNKNVDGILCVRGGYGAIRILDLLDYKRIKQNPKALIGYSDVTALLSAIYEQTGLVTFHGPVGISSFDRFTLKSLKKVLIKPKSHYKYPYKREKRSKRKSEYNLYTIRGGKAKGKLIGGNLSVIDSMIGSKFELDFKDKLVYLEDVQEKTYKIDKMLVHLLQATNIKDASGIILGVFKGCDKGGDRRLSLKVAISDLLKPLGIPISYGFPFGHISRKITIPTGVKAKFNASKNTLKLLEKAVR